VAGADKEDTVDIRVGVPKHDDGRLGAVASGVFCVTKPMLARMLIHYGLENFEAVYEWFGKSGAAKIRVFDGGNGRAEVATPEPSPQGGPHAEKR
jgi:hypothetical protein